MVWRNKSHFGNGCCSRESYSIPQGPSHHATLYLPGDSVLCGLGNFPLWPFCIFRSINCHTGPVTNFFHNLANLSCAVETPPCNLTSSLRRFFHVFSFNYFSAWTRPAGSWLNQDPRGGSVGAGPHRGHPEPPETSRLGRATFNCWLSWGGNAW